MRNYSGTQFRGKKIWLANIHHPPRSLIHGIVRNEIEASDPAERDFKQIYKIRE